MDIFLWFLIFHPIAGIITMIIAETYHKKKSGQGTIVTYKDIAYVFCIGFFGGYLVLIIGMVYFLSSLSFWDKPIRKKHNREKKS